MNKEIKKFPVGKEEDRKQEAFILMRGIDIYNKIEFNDKREQKFFQKSMHYYLDNYKNKGKVHFKKMQEAIQYSKYNVEARISLILESNEFEFRKEAELIKLQEETVTFNEGWISTNSGKINIFHYKVSTVLADFYIFNKLYKKVDIAYKDYNNASMKDDIFLFMYYKKLISYILLSDFPAADKVYNIAKQYEKISESIILLSRVFYCLLIQDEIAAAAFCQKLMNKDNIFRNILDKFLEPSVRIYFNSGANAQHDVMFIKAFSFIEPLFYKEYFFNFFMNIKESCSIISNNLDKHILDN